MPRKVKIWLPLAASALLMVSVCSASSGKPLNGVQFLQYGGAVGKVKPGNTFVGDWTVLNNRKTALSRLRVDLYLPKQTVDKQSIFMQGSTHTLIGNHVHFVVKVLPARRGLDIRFNYKVNNSATGQFCDKLLLHYGAKVADYSPPCVEIVTPNE